MEQVRCQECGLTCCASSECDNNSYMLGMYVKIETLNLSIREPVKFGNVACKQSKWARTMYHSLTVIIMLFTLFTLLNKSKSIIVSANVFRTRLVFTRRRWTFHERVNTDDEHRTRIRCRSELCKNALVSLDVRVDVVRVRDCPKSFIATIVQYSKNKTTLMK